MRLGYIRVSTIEQNEARQEVLMEKLGVERVFIDKQTGTNTTVFQNILTAHNIK